MNDLLIWILKSLLLTALIGFALKLLKHKMPAKANVKIWVITIGAIIALPAISKCLPQTMALQLSLTIPKAKNPAAETFNSIAKEITTNEAPYYVTIEKPTQSDSHPALNWFIAIWMTGSLLLILRLLISVRSLHKLRKSGSIAPSGIRNLHQDILGETELIFCPGDISPQTFGVIKPVITLSNRAKQMPEPRLRSILKHEMAHIKSHDPITIMITEILCSLAWLNPALWIAKSSMRTQQELAADDFALSTGTNRIEYAETLLEIAVSGNCNTLAAAIKSKKNDSLEDRIRRILDNGENHQLSSRSAAVLLSMALLAFTGLAGINVNAEAPKEVVTETAPSNSDNYKLVILDIGHGGHDPGAKVNDLKERTLNEQLTKVITKQLTKEGVPFQIVAEKDEYMSQQGRTEKINEIAKASNREAILISVHHNSSANRKLYGTRLYSSGPGSPHAKVAKNQADILKNLINSSAKITQAEINILRNSDLPAVLLEAGFMTNPQDLKKIQTPKYRQTIAHAIAAMASKSYQKGIIKIETRTYQGENKIEITSNRTRWIKDDNLGIASGQVEINTEQSSLVARPTVYVESGKTATLSIGTQVENIEDVFEAKFTPTRQANGEIKLEFTFMNNNPRTVTLAPGEDTLIIRHQYMKNENAISIINLWNVNPEDM